VRVLLRVRDLLGLALGGHKLVYLLLRQLQSDVTPGLSRWDAHVQSTAKTGTSQFGARYCCFECKIRTTLKHL